ncbi:MAG: hypothetical protein PHX78_07265 [bacterium]|nr:hypothetical protein [bacterium]
MQKKNFQPETKEELLAYDLAVSLRDMDHIYVYLSLVREYTTDSLLKILGEVKEMPERKVRKSKGALFTYLARHCGERR